MAGFYYKSNEDFENHDAPQTEAPVAGIDDCFAACLRSAAIVALIEDYIRHAKKHGIFETGEASVEFAKGLCNQALDNGDMTQADCQHVIEWAEKNRLAGCDCKQKFAEHIFGEELDEVCQDSDCVPEEVRAAMDLSRQARAAIQAVTGKYGPIVEGYAKDFVRLYAKNFDAAFVEKVAAE